MKVKKITFAVFIVLAFSWQALYCQVPLVKVSPPELYIQLNTVGEIFVNVDSIVGCRAYSIQLSYNSQVVRCLSVTRGTFFSGWNTFFFTMIDSNSNLINVDEVILGAGYENGSGDFFKVEFLALIEGDVNLDFIKADLRDTLNNQIQVQTENGILHIVNPSSVYNETENVDSNILNAYPNPFNSSTRIKFTSENIEENDLSIYAITGEKVFSIDLNITNSSTKSFIWNGKNMGGKSLPSGIYLLTVRSKNTIKTIKLIMLK